MTSSKRPHSLSSADHVASLSLRAPWLPPVIRSRRGGTAGVRRAKPSRNGTPVWTTLELLSRFSVPGSVVQTAAALVAK